MSDENFKDKHFRASKAILDEPDYLKNENILTPFRVGRIITENGEIWGVRVAAFNATEERLLELWDQKPSEFTKIKLDDAN